VINFRYHIVSLTAVFLALAIGLVVGTAALNGPLADNLNKNVSDLRTSNNQYRTQVHNLTDEVNNKEQFATEVAPQLLAGKLTNRRVLVVSMQGATPLVAALDTSLGLAGAKITGHVEIEDKFVDPSNNDALLDLAEQTLTKESICGLPTNSDGVETSMGLLATALVERDSACTEVTPAARKTIISAYEGDKYLSVNGSFTDADGYITEPAEVVLFLVPQPFDDSNASGENQDLVTMVTQLAIAGPIVVGAASPSGGGNVIGAITSDATLSRTVSTVDNVETAEGQVAAVLALNEQLVYKKTGHYGLASGATSLLPKWPEE
jgi:Copper transport outer membrane protein, MctB